MCKMRILHGRVVRKKMKKTVVVVVERIVQHAFYRKFVKRNTKFHVHNEYDYVNVGDIVSIKECRPISKTKSWTLISVIKKSIV